MKITALFLLAACLQVSAKGYSQKVTLSEKNVPVEKILQEIKSQTGYDFFYNLKTLELAGKVSVKVKEASIIETLDACLKNTLLTYSITDKIIVINQKPPTPTNVLQPLDSLPVKRDIKGRVMNENKESLAGATVTLKGSKVLGITNAEGLFSVNVNIGDVLVISSVGYESIEYKITSAVVASFDQTPGSSSATNSLGIRITLKRNDSPLDEVQIIAYGTTSKRIGTGNVTTIKAEDIAKSPARNVLEILQGMAPGLFIQQNSGLPGGRIDVTIRGTSTFGASEPLVIVDGVPFPLGGLPIFLGPGNSWVIAPVNGNLPVVGGNGLDFLNPSMIESINILKDADATSIYGSRGAYGVILITTKKGKRGSPVFNANVSDGISVRGKLPQLLNTEQYIDLRKEAKRNDNLGISPIDYDINGTWPTNRYTDWYKTFMGEFASVKRVNASYAGGSEDYTYLVGGNYRKQGSIQLGKGSVRDGGLNFNIGTSSSRKFSVNLSGGFTSTVNDEVPVDFSIDQGSVAAPNAPPLFHPDGTLNWTDYRGNPAASKNLIYKNVTNNLISNITVSYRPIKTLSINVTAGYNNIGIKEFKAQPFTYTNPSFIPTNNSTLNTVNASTLTFDPNISYTAKLGIKGKFSVITGLTMQDQNTSSIAVKGINFLSDQFLYDPAFTDPANITTSYLQYLNRYLGYFGRINYEWAGKYILDINMRYDGSTKFGSNSQFGSFGSVGAAWILSKEKWFANATHFISFAKLRGSFGTQGGDAIPNYEFLSTYTKTFTSYQGSFGLVPFGLANPELHWEHNRKSEGNILLEFFNGSISLDVTYYNNRTSDQLVSQPLPSTTGFTNFTLNSPALISNTGYEIVLGTRNISSKNFSWVTSLNVSIQRNKLLAYPGLDKLAFSQNYYVIGKSVNGFKVFKYAGVNPQTGLRNYVNRFGVVGAFRPQDGTVLDQTLDRTEYVDIAPKFFGGIQNSFKYKGFSLDVRFSFVSRNGLNYMGSQSFPFGASNTNVPAIALRRWRAPGDITDIPRAAVSDPLFLSYFKLSKGAYSDASYIRLSNASFSYDFSLKILERIHIKALKLSVQGTNLLTISKYEGLDPENLGSGMPPMRVFTTSLNVTF